MRAVRADAHDVLQVPLAVRLVEEEQDFTRHAEAQLLARDPLARARVRLQRGDLCLEGGDVRLEGRDLLRELLVGAAVAQVLEQAALAERRAEAGPTWLTGEAIATAAGLASSASGFAALAAAATRAPVDFSELLLVPGIGAQGGDLESVVRECEAWPGTTVINSSRGILFMGLEGANIGNGILTVDTMQQAVDRAGGPEGNKGEEAAMAVIETVNLLRRLD